MKFAIALILAASAFTSTSAHAADRCEAAFSQRAYSAMTIEQQRAGLIETLRISKTPAFLKETSRGSIPVVLVNHATAPALRDFMNESVGVGTLLQPGSGYTDHGLLRLGGVKLAGSTSSLQIDWAPMNRNWFEGDTGEIHGTGLMWRSLESRMKDSFEKNRYSRVSVEVAIAMKPQDRATLELHQRLRRAGIIALVGNYPAYQMSRPSPVVLDVDENCFQLASGHTLPRTREQLVAFLKREGLKSPIAMLERAQTREFLKRASRLVGDADALSPNALNPNMLINDSLVRTSLNSALPRSLRDLPKPKIEALGNALFALSTTIASEKILNAYGFQPNMTVRANLENPHVAAILVYDSPEKAVDFWSATYTTRGEFPDTGWGDRDATAPYADQHPL